MSRPRPIALTLLAGASLIFAGPASALTVTTEQAGGFAGSAALSAVGGPVAGFVGGMAGRAVGRFIQKKKDEASAPQVRPLQAEATIPNFEDPAPDQVAGPREVDATPRVVVERAPDVQRYAAAPGTLDYQYQRLQGGPVD